MYQAHPSAALILQYAIDSQINDRPWQWWEFRSADLPHAEWSRCITHPNWSHRNEYRRREDVPLIRYEMTLTHPKLGPFAYGDQNGLINRFQG